MNRSLRSREATERAVTVAQERTRRLHNRRIDQEIADMFQLGDVISYEDQANPRSCFVVIEVADNPWSTYKLRNVDTWDITWTDGRQNGWKLEAR